MGNFCPLWIWLDCKWSCGDGVDIESRGALLTSLPSFLRVLQNMHRNFLCNCVTSSPDRLVFPTHPRLDSSSSCFTSVRRPTPTLPPSGPRGIVLLVWPGFRLVAHHALKTDWNRWWTSSRGNERISNRFHLCSFVMDLNTLEYGPVTVL